MKNDAKEELIELPERNSEAVENEIKTFLATEEGQIIKADIELLNSMGFDKKMINKIYILLRPEKIEKAIELMIEINGKYQHDFIYKDKKNENTLCFICENPKENHLSSKKNFLLNYNNNITYMDTENDSININKN